jgi:GrpB-like predicted nucleotidyltransferase (UPF0157 family)/predicted enzyme related to lactoylglutathione lyase
VPDGARELRLVVTAPDYDEALTFYRDAMGLTEEAAFTDDNGGRATLLFAGRATIELADDAHAEAVDDLEVGRRVAGPVRLAFEVEDAAAMTERLAAAGARIIAPAVRTPWGSLNARLDSPDGQQVTVYSNDAYVVERPRLDGQVELADPDPGWSPAAADLLRGIRGALGWTALVLAHAGSTSVPGLPAKPVLDLVLGVPDPADEDSYVPALEQLGYRLRIREPEWHEHRLLGRADPTVNVHVFAAGSVEIERMLAFRDHLRRDARDRELYLHTKQELASQTWEYMQDYADAKSVVVADILSRALSQPPSPLRGCFVVVTERPGRDSSAHAGELAERLALPLLSIHTVEEALRDRLTANTAGVGSLRDAAAAAVVALAARSGGAVLDGVSNRRADLAALPGLVVEVAARTGTSVAVPVETDWPVLDHDSPAAPDTDMLVRQIRQVAAGDLR